jgi:hypothetical protein
VARSKLRDARDVRLGEPFGVLAAGAVGELDASLLLYPVYYCLGNAAVALPIVSRAGSARPYSP